MKMEMQWNQPVSVIAKQATNGDATLLFMAQEAKRLMDTYVPARNMILSRNVKVYVEGDVGIVHYLSPYARFQFEGILMVSRITGSPWARFGESKVTTARALKYSKARHPLATSHWDKKMKLTRGREYAAAVQAFVRGGGL